MLSMTLAWVLASPLFAPAAPAGDEVEWLKDLDAGRAAARSSGKPLFVVFRCER
jgi:hypothetical protein